MTSSSPTLMIFALYPIASKMKAAAEVLLFEAPGSGPSVVECKDASTQCIIDCVAANSCSSTQELRCHSTAEQNCTVNLRENNNTGNVAIYTYQSPFVEINCLKSYPTARWNVTVYAHQRIGSSLQIASTEFCMQYSTVYAPVGKGSFLSIEAHDSGFQYGNIYQDHTTELYISTLKHYAFSHTVVRNIFDDSPLNIARNDSHYRNMDHLYRAPVTLNGCAGSGFALQFLTIYGQNHGHWNIYSQGGVFRDTLIYTSSDIPPYGGIAHYDLRIIVEPTEASYPLSGLVLNGIGSDYIVFIDVSLTGGAAFYGFALDATEAHSLSIACHDGAQCSDHGTIRCPLNDENACNFYCDDHNDTVCGGGLRIFNAWNEECTTPIGCAHINNDPLPLFEGECGARPVNVNLWSDVFNTTAMHMSTYDSSTSGVIEVTNTSEASDSGPNVNNNGNDGPWPLDGQVSAIAAGLLSAALAICCVIVLFGLWFQRRKRVKAAQEAIGNCVAGGDGPGDDAPNPLRSDEVERNSTRAGTTVPFPIIPGASVEQSGLGHENEEKTDEQDIELSAVDVNLDVSQYKRWTSNQVVHWMVHLNYEAHRQYEGRLRERFGADIVNGRALNGLTEEYLRECGVSSVHCKSIHQHLVQLMRGTEIDHGHEDDEDEAGEELFAVMKPPTTATGEGTDQIEGANMQPNDTAASKQTHCTPSQW